LSVRQLEGNFANKDDKENAMVKRFFAVLFCMAIFSSAALAGEFSADTIMTYKGSGKTTGKVYYKADRFRMDMNAPSEMIVITRMDKKVVWNIVPAEKMYMEMPFNLKNRLRVEKKYEGEIDRKQVGSETIDGHPAKKYLITYKSGKGTNQVYQWMATDINFPVKTEAVDGSWSQEFRNIKDGPQPDSLFEVPAGYKKFQAPGGMNMMQFR
jgi:outer membrane lipoprotein-sorting protein